MKKPKIRFYDEPEPYYGNVIFGEISIKEIPESYQKRRRKKRQKPVRVGNVLPFSRLKVVK